MKTVEHKYSLKNGIISIGRLFSSGDRCFEYGRIKDVRRFRGYVLISLFPTQSEGFREYAIRASRDFDIGQLKRGDVITLQGVCEERRTIERITLLNSCEGFPAEGSWNERDAARYRELDVVLDNSSMEMILKRNRIVFGMRDYMQRRDFLEIELPILKQFPDIAPSPHFQIANPHGFPSLFLRTTFPPFERLLVGLEKAYIVGPNFRNGDFSYKNLPEFQMFCMAVAARDYRWAARFVHQMFAEVTRTVSGMTTLDIAGKSYDLAKWDEVSLPDAFTQILRYNIQDLDSDQRLLSLSRKLKILLPRVRKGLRGHMLRAVVFDCIFEQRIVSEFTRPTFFYEVPWYLAGPAEPLEGNSFLKMRGEGYVGKIELMNAKSVLTSHQQTLEWHESLSKEKRRLGFGELADLDPEFLRSIRFGLVPGSLASFGIDRLVMMILGREAITNVTAYPLTQPQ